jgi:hypothetical protein
VLLVRQVHWQDVAVGREPFAEDARGVEPGSRDPRHTMTTREEQHIRMLSKSMLAPMALRIGLLTSSALQNDGY